VEQLGIHAPSLLVYIVNFLLLLTVLYFFGYKRILKMMDERAQRIRDGLGAADKAREDADKSQGEIKDQLMVARQEAQQLLAQARVMADRYREEEQDKTRQKSEEFLAQARADIERERDLAINQVQQQFAGLAIMAAGKIIDRSLDEETHRGLIHEVLLESGRLEEMP